MGSADVVSGGGVLRGVCRRIQDWIAATPSAVGWTLEGAERVSLPDPVVGPLPRKLETMRIGIAPPAVVCVIPGGRVFGAEGLVVTPDGLAIADTVDRWGWDVDRHELFDRTPEREEHIDGVAATLVGRGAGFNFGHFLGELIPRVGLVRDAGVDVDVWLVNRLRGGWGRDGLSLAGIDPSRVVEVDPDVLVSAGSLVVPSPTGFAARTAPWARRQAVRLLGGARRGAGDRLWISRDDAPRRRLRDEERIVRSLAPLGFRPVSMASLAFADQVALFASAGVVAGVHGAGLAHVIAAPPGGTMIELFHPHAVHPEHWRLAGLASWRYQPILADGEETHDRFLDRPLEDLELDVDRLVDLVRAVL